MKNSLLLVFIHGFMGNDDTFSAFPTHLAALLSHALPAATVTTAIYPAYATRGELAAAVSRLRDWLLETVIDAEVALGTPSPTLDPRVRVVLVGHSMGGIVAAEAALGIALEHAADVEAAAAAGGGGGKSATKLFPCIQGVLAFDTPFLGISPGLVSNGAEDKWAVGKSWYDGASKLFGAGAAGGAGAGAGAAGSVVTQSVPDPPISVPREASTTSSPSVSAPTAPTTAWQRWAKVAMVAGAAGAVAAAGAGAYLKREQISSSIGWVSSHLAFVGCLTRGEELKRRLVAMAALEARHGVGFANVYTCLGRGAPSRQGDRTFCVLPRSALARYFHKAVNDAAGGEADAHMYMFAPGTNPGYYAMAEMAKGLVVGWVPGEWGEGVREMGIMHEL